MYRRHIADAFFSPNGTHIDAYVQNCVLNFVFFAVLGCDMDLALLRARMQGSKDLRVYQAVKALIHPGVRVREPDCQGI